jgi:hypothetical protein
LDARKFHVVTVSAQSMASLEQSKRRTLHFLQGNGKVDLVNLAYTTTARRNYHPFRAAYYGASTEDIAVAVTSDLSGVGKQLSTPDKKRRPWHLSSAARVEVMQEWAKIFSKHPANFVGVRCFSQLDPKPMAPGHRPDASFVIWATELLGNQIGNDGKAKLSGSDFHASFYPFERDSGPNCWDLLVDDKVECFQTPGDHFSIMTMPQVSILYGFPKLVIQAATTNSTSIGQTPWSCLAGTSYQVS